MSTQSRILRLMQTSVTIPCIVSGSMRGKLPASGSPLGLPFVTSNRNIKSCLRVGSQTREVAVVVMVVTPFRYRCLLSKSHHLLAHRCHQCCWRSYLVALIDSALAGGRNR